MTSTSEEHVCSENSSDFPEGILNDLQCPICLEFFKHPVILPCSHVMCRSPCAEHLFEFNFIRCPVCRENCFVSGDIGSLPRVIALESIIEKYRSDRQRANRKLQNQKEKNVHQRYSTGKETEKRSKIMDEDCSRASNSKTVTSRDCCVQQTSTENSPNISPTSSPDLEYVDDATPSTVSWETLDDRIQNLIDKCLSASSDSSHFEILEELSFDANVDVVTPCLCQMSESLLYCSTCERTVCDVCESGYHVMHEKIDLDIAALQTKDALKQFLERAPGSQDSMAASLQQYRQWLKDLKRIFLEKRGNVNNQCDALLAEVEHKRSLFLADFDHEERMRKDGAEEYLKLREKVLDDVRELASDASQLKGREDLSSGQINKAIQNRLLNTLVQSKAIQGHTHDPYPDLEQTKVVDFGKEQALLRDMHYLTVPGRPAIDVGRCARNENTVALFLSAPDQDSDVIDNYVIRYGTKDHKALGIEEIQTLESVHHMLPRTADLRTQHIRPSLVAILEHILPASAHQFCVTAENRAGQSASSEVVQCVTLSPRETVVPVPVIEEGLCRSYPSSIRVFTPSPRDVAPEQNISHSLLFRSHDRKSLWCCLPVGGKREVTVLGLESETLYEFSVMAANARGECQLSAIVVLGTESQ